MTMAQLPRTSTRTLKVGTVARVCHVSDKTVCNWIDRGHLRGRRMPPGRRMRVVDWPDLVRFFAEHDMPDAWLAEYEENERAFR